MESITQNTSTAIPMIPTESISSTVPMTLTNQVTTYTYLPVAAPANFDSSSSAGCGHPIQSTNLTVFATNSVKTEPINMCAAVENSSKSPIMSNNENIGKSDYEKVDNTDYRAWILEAIDKLRERKARPDAEKISVLLKRYHNVSLEETKSCLAKLADAGVVVCVDYKGNVSYRNPSKWRKVSNGGGVLNTPSISNRIVEIVRQLTNDKLKKQGGTASGCPVDLSATASDNTAQQQNIQKPSFTFMDIEFAMRKSSVNVGDTTDAAANTSYCDLQGQTLRVALERECAYGKLMKYNGNYILDENSAVKKKLPTKKIKTPSTNSTNISKSTTPLTITTSPAISLPVMPAMTAHSSIIQPFFRPQHDRNPTICANYTCIPVTQPQQSRYNNNNATTFMQQQEHPAINFNTQPVAPYKQEPVVSDQSSPISYRKLLEQSPPLASTASNTTVESSSTQSEITSSTLTNGKLKLSRRGRPPGSKNRKSLDNNQPQNKKPKFDYSNGQIDANNIKSESCGSDICQKCGSNSTQIEDFLTCKDCSMKAHPSCIGYWAELTERARMSPWQCSDCKTCCICQDAGAPEQMLICDTCDKGYHTTCHNPPVNHPVDEAMAWVCHNCQLQGHKVVSQPKFQSQLSMSSVSSGQSPTGKVKPQHSNNVTPSSLPSRKSPGIITNNHTATTQPYRPDFYSTNNNNNNNNASEDVDPRSWSVDDVAQWLVNEGFQREAKAFKEQEIDGPCLLLMKRMDVLTELGIKLGPAVKIYERIKRFQNKGAWSYNDVY